jgi:RNA:NAD 2'-phosphotransferase (TPT1/KptA family)
VVLLCKLLADQTINSFTFLAGMRSSSAIIVHVDIIAALLDGIPFFVASNGAVLTSGKGDSGVLPLDYISKVEETNTGAVLWQPSRDQEQHINTCTLAQ